MSRRLLRRPVRAGLERRRVVLVNHAGPGSSPHPPTTTKRGLRRRRRRAARHLELERFDLLGPFPRRVRRDGLRAPPTPSVSAGSCSRAVRRFGPELSEEAEAAFAAHRNRPWFDDAIEAQRRRQDGLQHAPEQAAALYARARPGCGSPATARRPSVPGAVQPRTPGPERPSLLQHPARRSYDHRPRLHEISAPTLIISASRLLRPQVSAREWRDPELARDRRQRRGPLVFAEAHLRFRTDSRRFWTRCPAARRH